jgi:hypothetical protein
VSCVPNVANVSRLFVFVLCLVFPMSLGCLSRHWQQLVHKTYDEDKQPRDIGNIGYTRHMRKTNNLETLGTLGTKDTCPMLPMSLGCPFLCVVLWFCVLFVFVVCLVYPMFPISLGCLSSSCVLDKQPRDIGNIGYTRHMTKTNNLDTLATLGTQDT